ncbi:MAG TPA: cold-shock protein [Beijerinckiaceae bacterium]|nr:cold-shock protein [Beijerinckiaceae bacterium]
MTNGIVKFFDLGRGFGFIEPENGGKDVFVHISAMEQAGICAPTKGEKLRFDAVVGSNGKVAAQNISRQED